jgi:hypothetical protein
MTAFAALTQCSHVPVDGGLVVDQSEVEVSSTMVRSSGPVLQGLAETTTATDVQIDDSDGRLLQKVSMALEAS